MSSEGNHEVGEEGLLLGDPGGCLKLPKGDGANREERDLRGGGDVDPPPLGASEVEEEEEGEEERAGGRGESKDLAAHGEKARVEGEEESEEKGDLEE